MKLLTAAFITFFITSTFAKKNNHDDSGFYGLLGLDFGYASVSEDNVDTRSGLHTGIKGIFSYYQPSHIVDLGFGWFYNEVDNDQVTTKTSL